MPQKIEAPNTLDVDSIARQIIHAEGLVTSIAGKNLDGSEGDLLLLQSVLDCHSVEPEATYSLQALGMAMGKVFVDNNPDYDWWMVEDEYGRDPAIRLKETSLLAFPQTMISKRVEDGEVVNVQDLYFQLRDRLEEIRQQNHGDA